MSNPIISVKYFDGIRLREESILKMHVFDGPLFEWIEIHWYDGPQMYRYGYKVCESDISYGWDPESVKEEIRQKIRDYENPEIAIDRLPCAADPVLIIDNNYDDDLDFIPGFDNIITDSDIRMAVLVDDNLDSSY